MSEKLFLKDDELSKVTGGAYVIKNKSPYSSGSTPKFRINQRVLLENVSSRQDRPSSWDAFSVLAVSATPDGGTFYKEFTYTLKGITSDLTIEGVYESCIREA